MSLFCRKGRRKLLHSQIFTSECTLMKNLFNSLSRVTLTGVLVGLALGGGVAQATPYVHKQFIPGMTGTGGVPVPPAPSVYATWNPSDKSSYIALTNGNLTAASSSGTGAWRSVRSTIGKSSGKWYWEVKIEPGSAGNYAAMGIADTNPPLNGAFGGTPNYFQMSSASGTFLSQGYLSVGTKPAMAAGDVFSFLLDADAKVLFMYRNCSLVNSGGYVATSLTGTSYAVVSAYASTHPAMTANFGQTSFVCPVTTGYNAGLYN